jgi:hypothetical protein
MTTGFRRMVSWSGVLGLALAAASCGGGAATSTDGGTTGAAGSGSSTNTGVAGLSGSIGTTPVALCKQVVDTFCTRLFTCPGVADGGASDIAGCQTDYDVYFGCDRAGTTPGFDLCLSDFKNESCVTLFPTDPTTGEQSIAVPGSCNTPTAAIPATTAQQQCGNLAETNCMRILQCMNDTSADDLLACEEDIASDCGFAETVGSTFDTCQADLQVEPCSDFSTDGGTTDDDGGASAAAQAACMTAITFAN